MLSVEKIEQKRTEVAEQYPNFEKVLNYYIDERLYPIIDNKEAIEQALSRCVEHTRSKNTAISTMAKGEAALYAWVLEKTPTWVGVL